VTCCIPISYLMHCSSCLHGEASASMGLTQPQDDRHVYLTQIKPLIISRPAEGSRLTKYIRLVETTTFPIAVYISEHKQKRDVKINRCYFRPSTYSSNCMRTLPVYIVLFSVKRRCFNALSCCSVSCQHSGHMATHGEV